MTIVLAYLGMRTALEILGSRLVWRG